jgi:UDP-N-acetylmuramate--alanine ligase
MKFPREIGPLHFVGIGGIGMSGIAEVMATLGYSVQGSDLSSNANVERLRQLGIPVAIGHAAENIGDAQVVVISSAVKPDNPEVIAARERFLPIVRRAEMLAELMRFRSCVAVGGTHGKTTTTSIVAALLDAGDFDPTVVNGGIINAYGTNARLGKGEWMVVEADESDGTFVKLPADVVIVTNIDPEHLDYYGNFNDLKQAFVSFVQNVPFYGFAVMCIDHPIVQQIIGQVTDRRVITYGRSPQADVRLTENIFSDGLNRFTVRFLDRRTGERHVIEDLALPMPGEHNALNATAAVAVARQLGISDEAIRKGLAGFTGVKRRFTRTGAWNGVTIYDDYGHHPVEIAAVLKAARRVTEKRVIAVMQPHRYSRLHNLFDEFCACFNDAHVVVLAPVYAAGEAPIEGVSHDALMEGMRARGHRSVMKIDGPAELASTIGSIAEPGDIVVCLGAGSISQWAYALPGELERLG